jgi:pSer/pThr/pTyr-binding forkhead associated (FHA) protein
MAVRLVVRHEKSGDSAEENASFEFDQARVTIGRSKGADVLLPDVGVSALHATLSVEGSRYTLTDEGSTNGTSVNGTALVPKRPRALESGDEIEIGIFHLTFSLGPMVRAATTAERTASLARRLLRELSVDVIVREPPCLHVVKGPDLGTKLHLGPPPQLLVIGRGDEAHLALSDVGVSRVHMQIERDLDGALARDLASKNGLVVNGKHLRERRLRHGDVLSLSKTEIAYEDPAEVALRGLEALPDEPLTITRTAPSLASGESKASASLPPAPSQPLPTPEPVSRPPEAGMNADAVVYTLAALVLLASLAGLVWLFK